MKKLFKTLILCLLVLAMSLSAFACGEESAVETVEAAKKRSFEGTHIRTQTETGKYLVKDGATDYKLIVTDSTNEYLTGAKADFIILFERATGISIEAVLDEDVPDYTEDAKYISLGNTKLVEQAGIDKEEYSLEKLGHEGVRIMTVGNSIFLLGANIYGVNYSIYTLFELMFNFEMYHRDCIYIDTNVYNVPLMNYDVTEIPDVPFCDVATRSDWKGAAANDVNTIDSLYYGANAQEEVTYRGARFRDANYGYYELTCLAYPTPDSTTGYNIHNILNGYLPAGVPGIENKWYSTSGTQACFTAHGDAESLDRFVDHVVDVVCDSVSRYPTALYPEKNFITITCSDGSTTTCMCDACSKIAEANNGAYIASHIMFLNRVADKVQDWMEDQKDKDFYREDFNVVMFSYGATRPSPVYYDEETDTYTPTSEDMILHKGATIFYVGWTGLYPIYHEASSEHRRYIEGWKVLTQDTHLWHWTNSGPNNAGIFYDVLGSFNNDYYEHLAYCGVDLSYQANWFSYNEGTAFMNLGNYISKKLKWNCHLDMNELVDNFYRNMYGDAADIMKGLYDKLKTFWYVFQDKLVSENLLANAYMYTKERLPYDFNLMWYNEVEKAVAAVSAGDMQEEDPDGYKVLVHRIRLEAVAPLCNIIVLHGKGNPRELNDAQLGAFKSALFDIVQHHPNMSCGGSNALKIANS
ncbi:MAG: DUF4838 domain-containing protein [Clostridia bacterium]|nr:DUF4838 domain-containing protein [Clostridia bacterium]